MRCFKQGLGPLALAAYFLVGSGMLHAQGNDLPPATELRLEAEQAGKNSGPLIVIFSRRDCKYCEQIKRDYLKPLAANPRYRERIVIRQVNQDSEAPLKDFRNAITTHANFARSEKIKLVPVVAFFGANGERLAEPIVGARLPDFYQGYLESAIEQSMKSLRPH
jgi:thioredoxin-related protein